MPDLQVSPFAGDISKVLGRVTDSFDQAQLYAEIPADSTQTIPGKKKSKIGKLTGRLTKLVTTKKAKEENSHSYNPTGNASNVAQCDQNRRPELPAIRPEEHTASGY
jgi:hypothetical protein